MDLNSGAVFSDQIRIRRGDGVLSAPGARYDKATGQFSLEGGLQYRDSAERHLGQGRRVRCQGEPAPDRGRGVRDLRGAGPRLGRHHHRRPRQPAAPDGRHLHDLRQGRRGLAAARREDRDRPRRKASARPATPASSSRACRSSTRPGSPTRSATSASPASCCRPSAAPTTRGLEFQIPYYINLAPELRRHGDAALHGAARPGADVGVPLPGRRNTGKLEAEYLPNDEITTRTATSSAGTTQSMLGRGWRATLDGRAGVRHATTSRISTAASRPPARPISNGLSTSSTSTTSGRCWPASRTTRPSMSRSPAPKSPTSACRRSPPTPTCRERRCSASTGVSTASCRYSSADVGTTGVAAAPEPGRRAAAALPGLLAGALGGRSSTPPTASRTRSQASRTGRAGPRRSYSVDLGTIFERGARGELRLAADAGAPGAVRAHPVPGAGRPACVTTRSSLISTWCSCSAQTASSATTGSATPTSSTSGLTSRAARRGQRHPVPHGHRGPVALLRLPGRHPARRLARRTAVPPTGWPSSA